MCLHLNFHSCGFRCSFLVPEKCPTRSWVNFHCCYVSYEEVIHYQGNRWFSGDHLAQFFHPVISPSKWHVSLMTEKRRSYCQIILSSKMSAMHWRLGIKRKLLSSWPLWWRGSAGVIAIVISIDPRDVYFKVIYGKYTFMISSTNVNFSQPCLCQYNDFRRKTLFRIKVFFLL